MKAAMPMPKIGSASSQPNSAARRSARMTAPLTRMSPMKWSRSALIASEPVRLMTWRCSATSATVATIEKAMTAMPMPLCETGCGAKKRGTASMTRKMAEPRSEEHTSEIQSLMRISYAVFCLKKKIKKKHNTDEKPKRQHHILKQTKKLK